MAANTLSVYIKGDFFDEVKQAQADNKINVNEICTKALQDALHPSEESAPTAQAEPQQPTPLTLTPEEMAVAAQAFNAQETISYEINYSASPQEAGSFMQLISEDPASWIQSMAIDSSNRYVFLVATSAV